MKRYWKQISKKYSKSFAELCKDHDTIEQWGNIDSPSIWGIFINEPKWVLRHLFDFFDSRKIHCYCYTPNGLEWHYSILTKGTYDAFNASKLTYKSRERAELACYEKAFELLEEQCNLENRSIELTRGWVY